MKIVSILSASLLLICGCSDDSVKIAEITSEKYELMMENEFPLIHTVAINATGRFNITMPGETKPVSKENKEFEETFRTILNANPKILDAIMSLNSIEFFSDTNVQLTLNGKVFPDEIDNKGTFAKTLKGEFTYDKIVPNISQLLATYFLDIPMFGKLSPAAGITYSKSENGRMLLLLDYKAMNFYTASVLSQFEVPKETIDKIKALITQYSKVGETLEIGFYFNKIN